MKRKIGLFAFPLVAVMSLTGCKKKPEEEKPESPKITVSGASEWGVNGKTSYTSSVEGVAWSSSNPSVATISESGELVGLSAGSTILTASKEGYESGSITVSVIANPYSFTEEELGWYAGVFHGESGTLDVQSTVAGFDLDGSVKTIFPTKIGEEEFKYTRITPSGFAKVEKETYKVLYFESKFNDADYRLRFTADEFKGIQLDKFSDGKYRKVAEYRPTTMAQFTGAYNAYGDLSNYNYVYVFTANEVNAGEGHIGYKTNLYYEYYKLYQETSIINELGYQTIRGEDDSTSYVLGMQQYDLSDEEYFEGVLTKNDETTGLIYVGEESDYWYADPTPFLTDLINEDGDDLSNAYDMDEDTWEYIYEIGSVEYGLEVSRDEHGLKYVFSGEDLDTYEVRIGETWSYTVGENTKKFGLASTLYEPGYWEAVFENADNSSTFECWIEYDYDWETDVETETFICNFDGEPVEEEAISKYVSGNGFVDLKFASGEKEIIVSKLTSSLLSISVDGEAEKYVSTAYIADLFDGTITNGKYDVVIDTEAHTATINDIEYPIAFYYSENYNNVVASFAGSDLVLYDEDLGLYFLINSEAQSALPYFAKSVYVSLYGVYTIDGTVELELSASGLSINGTAIEQWSLTALQTQSGFIPAFAFSTYALVPNFNKTMSLYTVSESGFTPAGTYVDKSILDSFVGKYLYTGEHGVESIEFTAGYKFYGDVWDEEHSEFVPTQYPYSVSYSSGVATLNVSVGESGVAQFKKLSQAFYVGNILYVSEALFYAQGIYKTSDDSVVVSVWENRITYSEKTTNVKNPVSVTSESILSIVETAEHVYTITTAAHTYVLTLNESNEVVSFVVGEQELTKVGEELFAAVVDGASVTLTQSEVDHTLKFVAQYNSYSNTMNCAVTYDGAPSDSGSFGLRAYIDEDGNVCFFFNGALTPVKIYVDGEHNLVAELL